MWEQIMRAFGVFYGEETHLDLTADETKAAIIEKPAKLTFMEVANPNAHDVWVQIYDSLLAGVTVGTTVPKLAFCIPAGDGTYNTVRAPIDRAGAGARFRTGLCYAVTKGSTGAVAPDATVVLNALFNEV